MKNVRAMLMELNLEANSREIFFFWVQLSGWLPSNIMITDIATGLIQFHSTSYWPENRAKC